MGINDASLVKKMLTAMEAPHLHTKPLVTKLDDNAKTVDLDVSTIFTEQFKNPVLGAVRSRLRKRISSPKAELSEVYQSNGIL